MKKIYILIFLCLFSFMFIKSDNKVSANEDDYIITEEISSTFFYFYMNINYDQDDLFITLDKIFFKNNLGAHYVYKGYLDMNIGQKNLFEIEVNGAINNLDWFDDVENVKELYFIIEFDNINTVDGLFRSDNPNITNIDDKTLKYSLDPYNIENNVFFNAWFGSRSNSNLPVQTNGNIRIKGLKLFLDFKQPVSTLKDVESNYSELPDINNDFIRIESMEQIHISSRSFKLFFKYGKWTYAFNVSFPTELDLNKIYNQDGLLNMSYSVDAKTKDKLLYIQPNKDLDPYPLQNGTIDSPASLNVGFYTLNLSKMTFSVVNNLNIQGLVNKEDNRNAYAYLFFNIPIDKIYNIEIQYSYRFNYIFSSSDYKVKSQSYYHDEKSKTTPPWWLNYGFLITSVLSNYTDVYKIDQIKKIGKIDIPEDILYRYKTVHNGNVEELKNMGLYKVHLGQFKDLLSTSYDIRDDISVLNILYLYDGVVYDVPYDLIDQDWSVPDPDKPLIPIPPIGDLPTITFIKDYWIAILLAVGILVLIFKKKR